MCTTILAGAKATEDGSLIIARSADSDALKAQHMIFHKARKPAKLYRTSDFGGANQFEYRLPKKGYSYTTVPNWKTGLHGATGWNSKGVGITGTESIFAKDEALACDPYVKEIGITEDDIPDVILPQAKSARHGAELLGRIVSTTGCAEGFGVAFVDSKEIWYLETATAHHWLAVRLPDACAFGSANQGRLQAYNAADTDNFMASDKLAEFAIANGFWNGSVEDFNFFKAYTRDDERDLAYNIPRVYQILRKFLPDFDVPFEKGVEYPVFVKPESQVTLEDVKSLLRDHYSEGPLAEHDPYTNGQGGKEPLRPISVFRTYESHVMQVRPWLPQAIGEVTFLAMGMADLGVYFPVYQGMSKFPKAFSLGSNEADDESAYWIFRKVQTLAMTDYVRLAPIVKEAYGKYEAALPEKMQEIEKRYLHLLHADEKRAKKYLQKQNAKLINEALSLAQAVLNRLFTAATSNVQSAIFFANKSKKD